MAGPLHCDYFECPFVHQLHARWFVLLSRINVPDFYRRMWSVGKQPLSIWKGTVHGWSRMTETCNVTQTYSPRLGSTSGNELCC